MEKVISEDKLKEKKALEIFDRLRKHINEEVIIEYFALGSRRKYKVILKSVDNFSGIETSCGWIPFVNPSIAIFSILKADDKELLYYNPASLLYEDKEKPTEEDKYIAGREVFGNRMIEFLMSKKEAYTDPTSVVELLGYLEGDAGSYGVVRKLKKEMEQ